MDEARITKPNENEGESSFFLEMGSPTFSGMVIGALIPSELTARTQIV
jgi:hypothetical protein